MNVLHDSLVTGLAGLLILGAVLHMVGAWRQIPHRSTEIVWSMGAALSGVLIGFLQILSIRRPEDASLALLATAGALSWAAVAQAFGRAIGNRYDFRVLWHEVCAMGLALLAATSLIGALL